MLKIISTLAFVTFALPALAQQVNGTVKKIDEAQGKLTIDHGAIKNLDMDAMSMVFKAGDPAMLKGLKSGDKIKARKELEQLLASGKTFAKTAEAKALLKQL